MSRWWLLASVLLASSGAGAAEVVFYRCTDAQGELTLQNMPCPAGTREEKRVMQAVTTVPMRPSPAASVQPGPTAAATARGEDPARGAHGPAGDPAALAATPAPSTPAPAPASAPEPRLPPPNLFQCTTHDRRTYITESDQAQSRCVPLRTVGLDGNPATGAGQACEVQRDICARVPDEGRCEAWTRRLGEVRVAARFGRAENTAANEAEVARVQRILAETTCSAE